MLTWALTDRRGVRLATIRNRKGERMVGVHLNDMREARVGFSLEEEAAAYVMPLATRLKAWLNGYIVFNGPVLSCPKDSAQDFCQVYAFDPGRQLAASYVQVPEPWQRYGFTALQVEQTEILARLMEHPPSATLLAGGWADHGIMRGFLEATGVRRDRNYEPGKQVWEAITQLTGVIGGADVELEPLDREDGWVAQLNAWQRQGEDRSETVQFADGTGRNNCRIRHDPGGPETVTRFTSIGQADFGAEPPHYTSEQPQAIEAFGYWEGFEGRPDISEASTVEEHAQGVVSAQAFPPDFLTIAPAIEGGNVRFDPATGEALVAGFGVPPRIGPRSDPHAAYWVGDDVAVFVRSGNVRGDWVARVTDAAIREVGDAGDVQVDLEAVPRILAVTPT